MAEEPGKVGTLVESVARIADAFDRLVSLLEDVADHLDLPALNRDTEGSE